MVVVRRALELEKNISVADPGHAARILVSNGAVSASEMQDGQAYHRCAV